MKIHRVVQMLGATTSTGKLADDMYDLNYKDYYSEAKDKDIPISHMDFQHLVRAFIKQNDEVKHYKKLAEDNFISGVDDLEKIDRLENYILAQKKKLSKSEYDELNAEGVRVVWKEKYDTLLEKYHVLFDAHNVETSRDTVWQERYEKEVEKSDFWHKAYVERCTSSTGHNYVFSEIPNDCDGQQFTDSLKKYLNKDTYKMRVRGQYLKDEVKETEGWRKYERGQPIDMSKCLRVYLDKK